MFEKKKTAEARINENGRYTDPGLLCDAVKLVINLRKLTNYMVKQLNSGNLPSILVAHISYYGYTLQRLFHTFVTTYQSFNCYKALIWENPFHNVK